jgi:hypothetical protein
MPKAFGRVIAWDPGESVLAQACPYPEDDAQREQVLARCVLDYLAEHPQAMDTVEGIAEWWVMREQVRVDVRLLERVLHRLTEQGVLEKNHSGSQVRFSLTKGADTGTKRF